MDKASASGRYQKPSSGRRVRLIPVTPRQEPPTPSSSSTTDSIQSPDTFLSDSQSGSPRDVMRRVRPAVEMPYPFTYRATGIRNEEIPLSAPNSLENVDDTASLSYTQAMISTSSSSHDIIADTDSEEEEEGSKRTNGKEFCRKRSVGMEQGTISSEQPGSLVDIVVIDYEEEEEMKDGSGQTNKQGMEGANSPLGEIESEVVKEMQEFDRKRKEKSIENQ